MLQYVDYQKWLSRILIWDHERTWNLHAMEIYYVPLKASGNLRIRIQASAESSLMKENGQTGSYCKVSEFSTLLNFGLVVNCHHFGFCTFRVSKTYGKTVD